jgi:jasmonate ZIM domain-containing protein
MHGCSGFDRRQRLRFRSDDGAQAANKATLSIFYEGRMLVFEEFPADKAKALMQLAAGSSGSSSAAAPNNKDAPVPVVRVRRVPEQPAATAPLAVVPSDLLPIARKVSLQRFLQKRKER